MPYTTRYLLVYGALLGMHVMLWIGNTTEEKGVSNQEQKLKGKIMDVCHAISYREVIMCAWYVHMKWQGENICMGCLCKKCRMATRRTWVSVCYLHVCYICMIERKRMKLVSISCTGNQLNTCKLSLPTLLLHELIQSLS